jgi:uncharacterized membrane protein
MFSQRSLRVLGYGLVGIFGAYAFILGALRVIYGPAAGVLGHDGRIVATTLAAVAGVIWAAVFARLMFLNTDEFGQQASRVAWYWGGALGLLASLPIFVFVEFGGLTLLLSHATLAADHYTPAEGRARAAILRLGYLIPVVTQTIGFLLVRGWWWLTKR